MRHYAVPVLVFATLTLAAADLTFGPGGAFRLESSRDGFGDRSHGVIETQDAHSRNYPLPQSTFQDYKRLRPDDLTLNPISEKGYHGQEVIGPHQVEGNKLWFGKAFYDGEGERGVGAFGYFDTGTRQYELFSPPEVARLETSAILVETDVVWLGLDHFGEDISTSPGGLARWARDSQKVKVYPLEFAVTGIERRGKLLRLSARSGYAEFRDGSIKRFELRPNGSGAPTEVQVDKFPPPPSHY